MVWRRSAERESASLQRKQEELGGLRNGCRTLDNHDQLVRSVLL